MEQITIIFLSLLVVTLISVAFFCDVLRRLEMIGIVTEAIILCMIMIIISTVIVTIGYFIL